MMVDKEGIQKLIDVSKHRLHYLKVQKATFGNNTPPEILTEIEDIENYITELEESLGLAAPSYSLRMTSPRNTRTFPLPGPGYRSYRVNGVVDPLPDTGVWVIRELARPSGANIIRTANAINVFEAEIDENRVWECRIEFHLLPRRRETLYRVKAVIPTRDGMLLFQHHLDNRDKIDEMIEEAQLQEVDLAASYVPLTPNTLPSFLAETPKRQVLVCRDTEGRTSSD